MLSPRAAALFGLDVLASEIQGTADNRTRFLVIAQQSSPMLAADVPTAAMRTTIAFAVRNEPGSLLRALRTFADRGVNLSKLESRPSRTTAWEYVFWADLDASASEPACAEALEDLRSVATMVRVFGSYSRADTS